MKVNSNEKNGWAIDERNRIFLDIRGAELPSETFKAGSVSEMTMLRTKGEPTSMSTLRSDFGKHINSASKIFDVPASWIAGMIAIEATRIPKTLHFDPACMRDEDGKNFVKYWERPRRISAGLMQTLISTAQMMAEKNNLHPSFCGVEQSISLGHLCDPEISIKLGAAYMRFQMDRGHDGVQVVASYNAGGLYPENDNVWNLRTYGATRIPKFAAYANDYEALNA